MLQEETSNYFVVHKKPIELLFKFEPISIKRTPLPTTAVKPPERPNIEVGILVPVPDEEYFEDEIEMETTDSFYSDNEIESGPFDNGTGFGDGLEGNYNGQGDMPGVNKFVLVGGRRPRLPLLPMTTAGWPAIHGGFLCDRINHPSTPSSTRDLVRSE